MNKYLVVWSYEDSQLFKKRTPVDVSNSWDFAKDILESILDAINFKEANKREKVIEEVYKL